MNILKTLIVILFAINLSGCVNTFQKKQKEMYEAELICANQAYIESKQAIKKRWSNWVKCKKQYVLPVEVKWSGASQEELTTLYDNHIERLVDWENKLPFYTEQEAIKKFEEIAKIHSDEKAQLGFPKCLLYKKTKDTSGLKKCEIWDVLKK